MASSEYIITHQLGISFPVRISFSYIYRDYSDIAKQLPSYC